MAAYMRNRRALRRSVLLELAGGKCVVCETRENLEFNHIDPTSKSFNLSGAALDKSWARLKEELEKCNVMCTQHHHLNTVEQWDSGILRPWNDKTGEPYVHGTVRMYQEVKCRCFDCKQAKRLYRAKLVGYDEVHPPFIQEIN